VASGQDRLGTGQPSAEDCEHAELPRELEALPAAVEAESSEHDLAAGPNERPTVVGGAKQKVVS
jgi:hypothetical protein